MVDSKMLATPSTAYRSPKARLALVESIVGAAHGTSEPEWVEWKTHADLKPAEVRFAIAKFVLGAANRDPAKATRYAEGCAYLVVGAEPGSVVGTKRYDSATIQDWLEPYLGGAEGPSWDIHEVSITGASVLVFSVEPPAVGMRPFVLHKAYANFHAGTIFIRKLGKTEPAGPDDVAMLFRRGAPVTQFGLHVAPSVSPLKTIGVSDDMFEVWRTKEYESIAQKWNQSPRFTMSVLEKPQDEYVAEVNEYLERAAPALLGRIRRALLKLRLNVVELVVTNTTQDNFKDVVLRVDLPSGWVGAFDRDDVPGPIWPSRPSARRNIGSAALLRNLPDVRRYGTEPKEPRHVLYGPDKVVVAFASFDLRPEASVNLRFFVIPEGPSGDNQELQWAATATNIAGVARGDFEVEIDADPLDWQMILDRASSIPARIL